MHRHRFKAPGRRAEHAGVAHLATGRHQRQAHATAGRIASCPALARAGVGCVPVGAQGLTIDPGQRQRIEHALAIQAEQLRNHSGGGHFDQHHVVQPDPVEGILQRQHALDLVRLDHCQQHVAHGRRWAPQSLRVAPQPVADGKDATQVVRRVPPFGRQPGIVEIQPAHHRADVEGGLHRVQHVMRTRNARAVDHADARHQWTKQFAAGRERQRFQAAAQRVEQAVVRGLERQR